MGSGKGFFLYSRIGKIVVVYDGSNLFHFC